MPIKKSQQKIIPKTPKGPRVVIGMDVDDRDAIPRNEIPFVVAVLAPLSGNSEKKDLAEQQPMRATAESIDEIVAAVGPSLSYTVDSVLEGAKPKERFAVNLTFTSMSDFEPQNVARRLPDLNRRIEKRQKLRDLLGLLRSNPRLSRKIEDLIVKEAGGEAS
jgi:type VI secretion system protein ImpB